MYHFQYFKKESLEHFIFIQYPAALRDHELFASLSAEETLLYAYLLDRTKMSRENGWIDKDGNVYIICEIATIQKWMRCGNKKAVKLKKNLQEFGLIQTKKNFGADLIYVMDYSSLIDEKPSKKVPDKTVAECQNDTSVCQNNTPKCQDNTSEMSKRHPSNNNIIKTNFNHNKISYPVLSSESKQDVIRLENQTVFDFAPNIIVDFSKFISQKEIEDAFYEMEINNGIPYEWVYFPERMQVGLQTLSCWNDRHVSKTAEENHVYVLFLKNLIEMATSKKTVILGGKKVITYHHVLEQINKIYHNADMPQYCLNLFMDFCIERYQAAYQQREIRKINQYMKTLIWNTFDTFELDWDGYFNRTMNA